jgi:DNA-binding GntR family transcriptional regulator
MQLLPQRQTALGEQVAFALRRLIVTGRMAPGTTLVEGKLAEEYQVSRGPIRDAIRILAGEGLLSTSGRSAQVLGLTAHDIDELFSLREAMEHLALATALTTDAPRLGATLQQALVRMEEAVARKDTEEYTNADVQFHGAFYESAGHRRLLDVWAQYQPTIEVLLLVANEQHLDLAPSLKAHQFLASLIGEGNADAAFEELRNHLNNSRLRLRAPYEKEMSKNGSRPAAITMK